jgi:hypothetical protein
MLRYLADCTDQNTAIIAHHVTWEYRKTYSKTMPRGNTNLGVLCFNRCRHSGHWDQHSLIKQGGKDVLYIIKYHITKTYVIEEEQLQESLTPLLDEGEWSAPRPDHFKPGEWAPESIGRNAPDWNRTQVVQSAACCNIDWATPVPLNKLMTWFCM